MSPPMIVMPVAGTYATAVGANFATSDYRKLKVQQAKYRDRRDC